jgi:two-component system chemotaxis response regulator CheB
MVRRDIIAIGASAGGIQALRKLLRNLPADLPASVFVVMHIPTDHPSRLPQILARAGGLPVSHATDESPIRKGHVYVAPPNRHLVLEPHGMRVIFGPRQNRFRPAIDALFSSAASAFAARAIGVVLSGTLEDGCDGLSAIKSAGGVALVQDPAEAEFPQLPLNALRRVQVDQSLTVSEIAAFLNSETRKPADQKEMLVTSESEKSQFTSVTCPDCHGPILEEHGSPLRFRCIVGHSYSAEAMRSAHKRAVENSLWTAMAHFRGHATVLRTIAEQFSEESGEPDAGAHLLYQAQEQEQYASEIGLLLEKMNPPIVD